MPAVVDKNKCEGCEDCVPACPTEAIKMVDGKAEVKKDECSDCEACVSVCPTSAITMES